ncbi:MAG: hypothetical protein EXR95_04895 [Gemmatimonadetes bacterium]|nr:hypothetical protein [Gemmatimonadota bacterium]
MRYGADKPEFMRIVFRTDGAIELHVYAAEAIYQHCGDDKGEDVATCMRDGPEKYVEAYSSHLRDPHPTAPAADSVEAR